MSSFDIFLKTNSIEDINDDKVIDLSDCSQYPASVLANLDCTFALGDDSENFLRFLHKQWTQPKFHWDWNDITHEEAVKSDFLGRAYCSMNTNYRERRDALIASEGYRFVWKNKDIEPVPGLLSGEELCRMANLCLEKYLRDAKHINDREDRDARRWQLNPSYAELMADLGKGDDEADYLHRDIGCGMLRFRNQSYGNMQIYIVNPAIEKAYHIQDSNGNVVGFTHDDIDWDNVSQLKYNGDAKRLVADYGGLSIGNYKDGIARVDWILHPDGQYYADEDGFGMEDDDEVSISAYIDTQCRVVVKFQDMEDDEKRRRLLEEAIVTSGFKSRESV